MIKKLMVLAFFCLIVVLVGNHIIYNMAELICDEEVLVPVRYEYSGLFGNMKKSVQTTEENMDEMGKICFRTKEVQYFALADNINYILENPNAYIKEEVTEEKDWCGVCGKPWKHCDNEINHKEQLGEKWRRT